MIVFDLHCAHAGHRFEAWFASTESYLTQRARGLVECPICGDTQVDKAPMAPRLTRKGNQMGTASAPAPEQDNLPVPVPAAGAPVAVQAAPDPAQLVKMIEALADMQAKMLEKSVFVGDRFADQARAIHYGETDKAIIHGTTSAQEAEALIDEGIAIAPLPFPVVPPKAQN